MKIFYKQFLPKLFIVLLLITGILLTGINIYGLFQEIQPPVFFEEELRFGKTDIQLSYNSAIEQLQKQNDETIKDYSERVNTIIAKRLAHIHWLRYNNTKFNQIIPIWENYFLYFMGKFSGIPEFERYHFTNYKRSLKRGIGICGDASMIMSQVLNKEKIDNRIVSFKAHVVTSVNLNKDLSYVYDPDFGVVIPHSITDIQKDPSIVSKYYRKQGYSSAEIKVLTDTYGGDYTSFDGVNHFLTKKYYFEIISYALKWPFPLALILFSIYLYQSFRKIK